MPSPGWSATGSRANGASRSSSRTAPEPAATSAPSSSIVRIPTATQLLSSPPPPLVINQNLYPQLGFDPTKFEPVIVMAHVPNALTVNPRTVAASSVAEFVEYLRKKPREARGRHPRQRHHVASHRRIVSGDGQGEAAFYSLSRLGAGASGPARRRCRPDVRQSRQFAAAGPGRQSQAARGRLRPAAAVASRRADDRRKRCRASRRWRGTPSWRRRGRRKPSRKKSMPM